MIYDDDYLTDLPFEERINFIRDAVIEFDGRYPLYTKSEYEEWEDIYFYLGSDGNLWLADISRSPEVQGGKVCTKEEFYRIAVTLW